MGERFAVYIVNSTIMQAKVIGLDMLDIFWRPCRCPGSKYDQNTLQNNFHLAQHASIQLLVCRFLTIFICCRMATRNEFEHRQST